MAHGDLSNMDPSNPQPQRPFVQYSRCADGDTEAQSQTYVLRVSVQIPSPGLCLLPSPPHFGSLLALRSRGLWAISLASLLLQSTLVKGW